MFFRSSLWTRFHLKYFSHEVYGCKNKYPVCDTTPALVCQYNSELQFHIELDITRKSIVDTDIFYTDQVRTEILILKVESWHLKTLYFFSILPSLTSTATVKIKIHGFPHDCTGKHYIFHHLIKLIKMLSTALLLGYLFSVACYMILNDSQGKGPFHFSAVGMRERMSHILNEGRFISKETMKEWSDFH